MSKHFLSYSQIATHRDCPQKWNYAYVRRLTKYDPFDARVELEFGNWWHALRAASSIERGRAKGSLMAIPNEISTVDGGPVIDTDNEALCDLVYREADAYWKSLSGDIQDVWNERIGGSLVDRLEYVDARWWERWGDATETEEPLAVEVRWRRELPSLTDPDTGEVADPDTAMVGYIDEIYYDTVRGIVVARDHKTHKALGTQSAADNMMDSQLQVYAWGAAPLVKEWGRGPIRAVAYDRVRMSAPKTPKLTQMGSLSKAVTDFDLHTYLLFVGSKPEYPGRKKDGSQAGVYGAEEWMIQHLSDPASRSAWNQRTMTPLNRNVVTGHLRAAVDTAFDRTRSERRVEESGEAGRNLTSGCKWCPFVDLCRAEMNGGPEGEYDLAAYRLMER